jgi:hypothetical protein
LVLIILKLVEDVNQLISSYANQEIGLSIFYTTREPDKNPTQN